MCARLQQRTLLPGLFEEYIPRGVSYLDTTSFLVSYQPVGARVDQSSIIVRMRRDNKGTVMRLYQLMESDGTPFTGSVSDVTVSGEMQSIPSMVWTCDDGYPEYVAGLWPPADWVHEPMLIIRFVGRMDVPTAAARANRLVGIDKSSFNFGEASGPPLAVTVSVSYNLAVKPSGLHYDGHVELQPSLWVVEYTEPVALDPSGKASAQQGPAKFGSGNGPAQSKKKVGRTRRRTKRKGRTTKQPSTRRPSGQSRRRRQTNKVPDKPGNLSPIALLKVDASHCSAEAQQCGWAVRHILQSNGRPSGADGSTLTPNEVMFVGEGVRGFAIGEQLGRKYAFIERCSYKSAFPCRIEFHRWDNVKPQNKNVGGSVVPYRALDPGLPPDDTSKTDGKGDSAAPKTDKTKDPKQQDKAARKRGDARKKRPKRKRSRKRRGRKNRGSKARGKKGKKKPSTGPKERNLGEGGPTLASSFRLPSGATGLAYRFTSSENYIMFLFSSGAQPYLQHIFATGHDQEDSVHQMWLPGLATVPPSVRQNQIYLIYKNQYKITPRCLIPIGEECQNDSESSKKSKSKKGGKKTPRKRSRKLLSHWTPAQRRDVLSGRSPIPTMHHALRDHAYSLAGVSPPWGHRPATRADLAEHTTAVLSGGAQYDYGHHSASRAVAPAGADFDRRRHLTETRHGKYVNQDNCLNAEFEMLPESTVTIVQASVTIFIGIPVTIEFTVSLVYSVDLSMTLCIGDRVVIAALTPKVALVGSIFGGLKLFLIKTGIQIDATVMDTKLLPQARRCGCLSARTCVLTACCCVCVFVRVCVCAC